LSVAIGELTWRSNTVEPFDSIWGVESECNSVASARFIFLDYFKAERPIFPVVNYETPDSGVRYGYGVPSFPAIGGTNKGVVTLGTFPKENCSTSVVESSHSSDGLEFFQFFVGLICRDTTPSGAAVVSHLHG